MIGDIRLVSSHSWQCRVLSELMHDSPWVFLTWWVKAQRSCFCYWLVLLVLAFQVTPLVLNQVAGRRHLRWLQIETSIIWLFAYTTSAHYRVVYCGRPVLRLARSSLLCVSAKSSCRPRFSQFLWTVRLLLKTALRLTMPIDCSFNQTENILQVGWLNSAQLSLLKLNFVVHFAQVKVNELILQREVRNHIYHLCVDANNILVEIDLDIVPGSKFIFQILKWH